MNKIIDMQSKSWILEIQFIHQFGQLWDVGDGLHDIQLRAPLNVHLHHHVVIHGDCGLQEPQEASSPWVCARSSMMTETDTIGSIERKRISVSSPLSAYQKLFQHVQ